MKYIEELLKENKKNYDTLEVPEEMETRLKKALYREKTRKPLGKIAMVASLVMVFLFTYNYNTLAFYGKKLLGYDSVMSQTLQDLNELGKGQEIGKSFTFENGVELTLDGVMVDENQLLAFYRVRDPKGEVDEKNIIIQKFKGLFKRYNHSSGQGEYNEDNTEIIWVDSFEAPSFYERSLKFQGSMYSKGEWEEFSISFVLDRSKAMGHNIKQRINKTITLDNQEVKFEDILATPTQTVIKGSLASTLDLVKEQLTGEQVRPSISFGLIANGVALESQGGGLGTSHRGIEFHHEFDVLPSNLESLELQIDGLTIDKKVNEIISLKRDTGNSIEIAGQEIVIHNVEFKNDKTEITIETEENVVLTNVQLLADGKLISLESMHSEDYTKTLDKGVLKKRVIVFDGVGEELQLKVNKIHYLKEFNEIIEIPVK